MTLPYNTYFEQPDKMKFENPAEKGHRGSGGLGVCTEKSITPERR